MSDICPRDRCLGCDHCRGISAQDGFSFLGCYHEPYRGKWVVEIKDCPKLDPQVKIPKWVEKLLERRQKYAEALSVVGNKVDEYCESLGIDLMDGTNSLLTDVSIYLEPSNARKILVRL